MRRWIWLTAVLLLCASAYLFFNKSATTPTIEQTMAPDQLPPVVLDQVRHQLPNVNFTKSWRLRSGNYQVQGKDAKGKVREIEITPDGRIESVR